MPRVVHCKKAPGTYIGRPSKWGNPFSHLDVSSAEFRVRTRDEAVDRYRDWLLAQPELIYQARAELRGKDLACWCAPKRCHGDVLLAVANAPTVAIVGSRDYPRPEDVVKAVEYLCEHHPGWVLVSGRARNVDTWATEAASARGIPVTEIQPDRSLGCDAAVIQNREIAAQADVVIVFWDGKSTDVADIIGHTQTLGKQLLLVSI